MKYLPFASCQSILAFVFVAAVSTLIDSARSQESEFPTPQLTYKTDIWPILEKKCVMCHDADTEEGGLDLTNDSLIEEEYVVAEKPDESSLYDCLFEEGDFSLMPPEGEEDEDGNPLAPLTAAEKLVVQQWILQGAKFGDIEPVEKEELPAAKRIFLYSGFFHPAIVHFPIGLITISAFFIVVFFRNKAISDDAAYYLLFFGTLASIVACVVGWSLAESKEHFDGVWNFEDINSHRWTGIIGTILALISTVLGWRARGDVMTKGSGGVWKFGVILTAAVMGFAGHQGGEAVYGEHFYQKEAQKLIPEYWPFSDEESDTADDQDGGVEEKDEAEKGESDEDDESADTPKNDEQENDSVDTPINDSDDTPKSNSDPDKTDSDENTEQDGQDESESDGDQEDGNQDDGDQENSGS